MNSNLIFFKKMSVFKYFQFLCPYKGLKAFV